MRILSRYVLFGALLCTLLAGCGTKQAVPTPTGTPDPCAPANIVAEVKKVNDLQRQFDDASQLASVTPFAQLPGVVPSMQDVRRQAQDQTVPPCLATLKSLQLQQMNAVINTFLAFLAGGSQNPNTQALTQGIAQSRNLHGLYNQELARLIGATFLPPTAAPAAATNTPGGPTSTPGPIPSNTAAGAASATSKGPGPATIRTHPNASGGTLAMLDAGKSISAVGKTADGLWIEVADPYGNTGWVTVSEITLANGDALPVVTPAP
ncbi:MAG TPA: SH3 domain-containing protein [Anaerolineales bacterium]|nr:SH3 domain-containing protein [Anaerolineales bacterium]